MGAKKGTIPPNAGKGRVKGVPNKINRDVREMVLMALSSLGGHKYLIDKAESHPAAFMALLSRILPMQVTGADGGDIKTSITVTFVEPTQDG